MSATLLITDHPWDDSSIERELLAPHGIEVVDAPAGDEGTVLGLAPRADAIATCWARVTPAVIAAASRCRHIARMGIGLDNIAVDAATERGILVTNVPDYCVEEVAEHTIALLLAMARNVAWFHCQAQQGIYDLAAAPSMRRLQGQTLGLFGLGRIGWLVASKAASLGLDVIAHTASGDARGAAVRMVSFDELLATSDYLSLHAPLTPATRRVLDRAAFAKLKPGARLINTSRGGLVDEAALWEALQQQRLAGVALDVFDPEPPDLSRPLFRDERVIVTPHAAFVSQESLVELRTRVARQVLAALSGSTPENVINPHVLHRR
jgi:D-3-phosphoglycerate dehydrogenase